MKVYKGSIITCDEKNTVASYLVEDQGRIIYLGDTLPSAAWVSPWIWTWIWSGGLPLA